MAVKQTEKAVIMGQMQVNLLASFAAQDTPNREICEWPQSHNGVLSVSIFCHLTYASV